MAPKNVVTVKEMRQKKKKIKVVHQVIEEVGLNDQE